MAWSADGFSFLESAKERVLFMPGKWLEMISKDSGHNAVAAGGVAFSAGQLETRGDALALGAKTWRLPDLDWR